VADDPRKIMAALKHPYIEPKANISKVLYDQNQHQHHIKIQPQLRSNNSKTISHILAATTPISLGSNKNHQICKST
jgi:hypothetical protein